MNKTKEVSIIIPVYNIEKYLRQCLDSVTNQSFQNTEIIIINDCSTDGSYNIILEYQKKYSDMIVVNLEKNVGLGNARNEGLKIATGAYIVFIDSDDWVTPDYIEVLYSNIQKYNCDFIIANHYTFDDNIKSFKPFNNPDVFYNYIIDSAVNKQKVLTLRMIWSAWNKIYSRSFLTGNNIFFKTNKMEDILFIYETILSSNKFMLIKNHLYYYRINRTDSIMSNKKDRIYNCIEAVSKIKQLLASKNLYDTYKQSFYSYALTLFAGEFEVSKLSLPTLKKIANEIKHEFFEDMQIKLPKTYDKFFYRLRINLFYFCLKYNLNYGFFGKTARKFYDFVFNKKII